MVRVPAISIRRCHVNVERKKESDNQKLHYPYSKINKNKKPQSVELLDKKKTVDERKVVR